MSSSKKSSERLIKKYPNRRPYDTQTSSYITLTDVKQLVLDNDEFTVVDAKLVRQPIEKGRQWSTGNLVQILTGLNPGDVVVTGRLPELEPGTAVTIVGN